MRGMGQSEAPEEPEPYGVDEITADLVGLLDYGGVDKAIFVGIDFGAFAIQDLAQQGMAMIVATHQVNFIGRFADRVIFIDEGVVKVEGSADYVLHQATEPRLVRFLQEVREAT